MRHQCFYFNPNFTNDVGNLSYLCFAYAKIRFLIFETFLDWNSHMYVYIHMYVLFHLLLLLISSSCMIMSIINVYVYKYVYICFFWVKLFRVHVKDQRTLLLIRSKHGEEKKKSTNFSSPFLFTYAFHHCHIRWTSLSTVLYIKLSFLFLHTKKEEHTYIHIYISNTFDYHLII